MTSAFQQRNPNTAWDCLSKANTPGLPPRAHAEDAGDRAVILDRDVGRMQVGATVSATSRKAIAVEAVFRPCRSCPLSPP